MRVVVPFGISDPKTRLAPLLSADERAAFATTMLADVLRVIREADGTPTVLATDPREAVPAVGGEDADPLPDDVDWVVDDRDLTTAVDAALADAHPRPEAPVAVVMADLALLTPAAVRRLFEARGDVVVAPGRGGGTNAVVVRTLDFRVDYHGCSYRDHRRRAREVGAAVETVDSFRLSTDVDEPADLVEVLLHAEGGAAEWLRAAGVDLSTTDGRVGVVRGESTDRQG